MKIAISAESTIDLTKELLEKYNIKILPFQVLLGDNIYKDGEINSSQIFEFVSKNKILPKTSAINEMEYSEHFENLLKTHDAVIHFSLSSKLSCACSNAINAANNLKNVYVVDTKSLSTGIALLAISASKMAAEGLDAKDIYEKSLNLVDNVKASFVIDKLDYLYKGGRCSALSLFGANLLKIHPQILVKDGKMGVHKKYRGKLEQNIASYCKDTLEEFNNPDLDIAFITYTTATPEMIENARIALTERGFKNIYETRAGATISSHCGERTLGILFINN